MVGLGFGNLSKLSSKKIMCESWDLGILPKHIHILGMAALKKTYFSGFMLGFGTSWDDKIVVAEAYDWKSTKWNVRLLGLGFWILWARSSWGIQTRWLHRQHGTWRLGFGLKMRIRRSCMLGTWEVRHLGKRKISFGVMTWLFLALGESKCLRKDFHGEFGLGQKKFHEKAHGGGLGDWDLGGMFKLRQHLWLWLCRLRISSKQNPTIPTPWFCDLDIQLIWKTNLWEFRSFWKISNTPNHRADWGIGNLLGYQNLNVLQLMTWGNLAKRNPRKYAMLALGSWDC